MASIKPYKTAKGRAWRVQYRDPAGKNKTKQGFRTKNEAQAWADKNSTTIRTGDWIDPNAGKVTVGEVAIPWLNTLTHLKPSTRELYKQVWHSAVQPDWKDIRVSTIKPSMVQEWVSTLGRSPSWVRHAHNVLAQILDAAIADQRIKNNPARGVKLPRKVPTVKVYWSMQQLRAFAAQCGEREDLILLLGTSGLRWGEAIALRPCDLDPLRNRIHITRNAAKVGNGIELGTPKTHERRTVAVADRVMEMLLERGKNVGSKALLWTGRRGGWLRAPGHNTWFDGAMKRAMLDDPSLVRVTPHGLRHVAAGLLVNAGANVLSVSRQLGHADASVTLRVYAELFDDGLDSVAATMDAGFSDAAFLSWGRDEKVR